MQPCAAARTVEDDVDNSQKVDENLLSGQLGIVVFGVFSFWIRPTAFRPEQYCPTAGQGTAYAASMAWTSLRKPCAPADACLRARTPHGLLNLI